MNLDQGDIALMVANARGLASHGMAGGYDEVLYELSDALDALHERAEAAEARVRDLEELEEGYLDDIAAVNQRVRRLTKGLCEILDCKGPYNGTVSERGGDPAVCPKCEEKARALLADSPDGDEGMPPGPERSDIAHAMRVYDATFGPSGAKPEGGEA